MVNQRWIARGFLLGGSGMTLLVGLTAGGCSSNGSPGGSGPGGSSSGASNSSGSSSGASSSSGSGSGGSSSGGSSGSSSGSGSGSGAASGGDGGAADAANPDATSGNGPVDSGTGACVTSAIVNADGGSVQVGGGKTPLLISFDNVTQVPTGWVVNTTDPADSGLTPTLSMNTTDGHTCPGSLQLTVPFTAFGQQADIKFEQPYPTGTPYTGTRFHFWVKVVPGSGSNVTVGNEFSQGNGQAYAHWHLPGPDAAPYANQSFTDFYPPNATSWQEVIVPLVGCTMCSGDAGPVSIDLDQLGADLLLNPQDSGAPATAVLLIDDIWLE